jgi:hypothetical protein
MKNENEPTLDQIEDYNNNESPQKRKTVIRVIILCLVVGAILATLKVVYSNEGEYVGTPEKPGIDATKKY